MPEDLGLELCEPEALLGGSARENAETMRKIFSGEKGPVRDVVLLNAAATLVVAGEAADLKEGLESAARSVDSGAAMEKLDALVRFTNE